MPPIEGHGHALARRLRALREAHWPGANITQAQLAQALGTRKSLSVPAISSWESQTNPKAPPPDRLTAYATFFATARSIEGNTVRLLDEDELTKEERERRDRLQRELMELREAAVRDSGSGFHTQRDSSPGDDLLGSPWRFANQRPITIVCAPVPTDLLQRMPYTDTDDPDYIEMYSYADLDALVELYGHIRAANPLTQVNIRLATGLEPDDYTSHLVLLGGVDWNVLTRDLLDRLEVPVAQVGSLSGGYDGYFEVSDGGKRRQFHPVLKADGTRSLLIEDVAHFFRGINPFNRKRTVTICNGMFGRGTLGAVRALTDARFRVRNADYINSRFAGTDGFSILARVPIVNGKALTPDWTQPETRLHEWPEIHG